MTTEQSTASSGAASTSQVREELGQDAERLKDTAESRAKQEAETRKSQAARAAGSASSALESAADELGRDDDAPDWLASAVRQAAGSIDRMAGQMEGRNVDEIGHEVARFARSNPGTFLAASAAAGIAAARVLRAGADSKRHSHDTTVDRNGSENLRRADGDSARLRQTSSGSVQGKTSRNDAYSGSIGGGTI